MGKWGSAAVHVHAGMRVLCVHVCMCVHVHACAHERVWGSVRVVRVEAASAPSSRVEAASCYINLRFASLGQTACWNSLRVALGVAAGIL